VNITWNKVLWFTAGAVIGAAVTGNYFKTKYERISQEEIDSVKRAFSVPQQSEPTEGDTENDVESVDDSDPTPEEIINYNSIISAQGYGESAIPVDSEREEVKGVARPYVISPVEFDTLDDYEVFSLIYYADGVLADETGNVIEDIESMVGRDSLNHFGEYEDDSVHVRNDAQQCDFEILRDLDKYSDVWHAGPRPDED
jgi:hypothetical protein